MTQETTELRRNIETTKTHVKQSEINVDNLKQRANNAEDHSRRFNLVFFGIPEEDKFESARDCEIKVQDIVKRILHTSEHIHIYRAHRLGGKDKAVGGKKRPMIARFKNYKDKEYILQALRQNDGEETFPVSEDYCKETQDLRKVLLGHLKEGKNLNANIKGGFVKYKTLVLIFKGQERNIYSHYSLQDIKDDPNWYTKPKVLVTN